MADSPQYGPYGQTGRVMGQSQQQQQQVDPNAMAQLFAMMGQNQLQQQREYFANQNQRRDMSGNVIDPTTGKAPGNAFTDGTFTDRLDRIAKEANAFSTSPVDTYTGSNPGYLTPGQVAQQMVSRGQRYTNEVPSINHGPDVWDKGSDPNYRTPIQGGFEFMNNPNLPPDQRFQDKNMGQIVGGLSKNPKPRNYGDTVIADGNGATYTASGYNGAPTAFDIPSTEETYALQPAMRRAIPGYRNNPAQRPGRPGSSFGFNASSGMM